MKHVRVLILMILATVTIVNANMIHLWLCIARSFFRAFGILLAIAKAKQFANIMREFGSALDKIMRFISNWMTILDVALVIRSLNDGNFDLRRLRRGYMPNRYPWFSPPVRSNHHTSRSNRFSRHYSSRGSTPELPDSSCPSSPDSLVSGP